MAGRRKPFKHVVKLRPCGVCEAESTGYHFGVMTCEACKVKKNHFMKVA